MKRIKAFFFDHVVGRIVPAIIWMIVIGFVFLIWQDTTRTDYVAQDIGVVTASGCVTGSYKGHNTYDCSVDIEFEHAGPMRRVLKFGLLVGDQIMIVCQDEYYFLQTRCMTVRYNDKYLVE